MKNSLDDAAKKAGETVLLVVVVPLGDFSFYAWLTVIAFLFLGIH